ncbi:(2Fe-2S)-binding protein [Nocardia thailandica]
MVEESTAVLNPAAVSVVPGRTLADPDWLRARIAEMGRSWGTTAPRVSGTLWWCMIASALVEPHVAAHVRGLPSPCSALDRIAGEVRPDGGVDRVEAVAGPPCAAGHGPAPAGADPHADRSAPADPAAPGPASPDAVAAAELRETLAALIAQVTLVSGAGVPALWAVVTDALANRALDAGVPALAPELRAAIGGRLPAPRFVEVAGRTFVHRTSCCLVFEVPGCQMCTSCPKRPAAERADLLARTVAG